MKHPAVSLAAVSLVAAVLHAAAPKGPVSFSLKISQSFDKPMRTLLAAEMKSFREEPGRLVWSGHPLLGDSFTVTATRKAVAEGDEWSLSYEGNETDWFVEEVSFPEWTVPRTDRTKLLMPRQCGMLILPDWSKAPAGKILEQRGPCFGAPKLVAAIGEDDDSFYLDQRGDARLYATRFEAVQGSEKDTCVLKAVSILPVTPQTRRAYALPYPAVTARYRGGWFEAAAIYREWVRKEDWYKKAAARDFSKLRDVAMWMWNRGRSEVTVPPAVKFMKDTGLKVALDWYWWHAVPYDTYYPKFWPPREPISSFKAGIEAIHAAGGYVQPYTNGMLWDCDDAQWAEGGDDSTIVLRDGKVKCTMFNPYTRQRQAWMCGEAPVFQERVRLVERTIRAVGMDGVYMDMIGHAAHGCCYNPRHRHPMGGGRHMTDNYRAYVEKVRADNPGFYLSTEEQGEAYLDLFESFIFVYPSAERFGAALLPQREMVPAFQAVYHGAVVVFGSYATIDDRPPWDERWGENPFGVETEELEKKYPDQFAVEFARGVVWGQQPTVHKFLMEHATQPRFAQDYAFMKDTARFYHANSDLLFDGEMCAPGRLKCGVERVAFLQRGSYTKPENVKEAVQKALPAVFHSVWRSKKGRTAAVLVNWSRKEQSYTLDTPDVKSSGVIPARSWLLVGKTP